MIIKPTVNPEERVELVETLRPLVNTLQLTVQALEELREAKKYAQLGSSLTGIVGILNALGTVYPLPPDPQGAQEALRASGSDTPRYLVFLRFEAGRYGLMIKDLDVEIKEKQGNGKG